MEDRTKTASRRASEVFDYVIVGGGAAGAILANRLSEDPAVSVCLLEAGPPDWHPFLHIPAGYIKMVFNPAFTWQFQSEPTAWTGGRNIPVPQGRTLGGSTSINGLVYNRGQREDFDYWAELGNRGWSYEEVLPYFKRMERRIGPADEQFHGRTGEMPVTNIDWHHPLCDAFIEGAAELGIPRNLDYNGATQEGVGFFQRTIHRGWRMSTSRTFLRPVRSRPNLVIRTRSQAVSLEMQGKHVSAVNYIIDRHVDSLRTMVARKEVILCCGAINTPRLLQIAGIGPADLLQRIGVPVRHALPGVGANLTDHFSIRMAARVRNIGSINELSKGLKLAGQISRWALKKPSILALSPSLVHFFCKSNPALATADLQGVFAPASYREGYVGMLDTYPGMTCGVWQHRPYSTGFVHARSADPLVDPLIQPRYLEDDRDQQVLLAGIRIARLLLHSTKLQPYFDTETLPGVAVQRDDELLDFVRRYGVSSYHVNGTSKMGPASDSTAVVDDQLRVHGLTGLRIVDASVMPRMPSANVCAATMMIAEKASDLIRGRAALSSANVNPDQAITAAYFAESTTSRV